MNLGRVWGHSAVDLTIKLLHDLGTTLPPPDRRRPYLFPVFECQRIGKICMLIYLRLIDIGGIGRRWIAARAWTQRTNVQQIHRALMVLLGSKVDGNRHPTRR